MLVPHGQWALPPQWDPDIPSHLLRPCTPVDPDKLAVILGDHPQAHFLIQGFREGFRIPHKPVLISRSSRNHKSAREHHDVLTRYIASECEAGRIIGPFNSPPHDLFISSPLGVIPKKEPGSFRIIHDLSYPKGCAVNDLIPNHLTSVSYEDFDHVADLINRAGKAALVAKVDIQSAFRILPIHPSCIHLFGFRFQDAFYVDKCLPMGCSYSCALFEQFSTTLQQVLLSRYRFISMSHILDDFIFIAPEGSPLCQQQLQCFLQIASYTGIPIKTSKTVHPTTCLPVHGIEVDTTQGIARLPPEKLHNLMQLLCVFRKKRSVPLLKWQSLIGHLSFTSRVVRPGRPYIRKLIDRIKGFTNPRHYIKVTGEIRRDCAVWISFLQDYNGVSLLSPLRDISFNHIQFSTDASNWGFAAVMQDEWF